MDKKQLNVKDILINNGIVILILLMVLFVGVTKQNFFSRSNFSNISINVACRFIIAVGVSGCLITKGTDLSAGRLVGLSACLAGTLLQKSDYSGHFELTKGFGEQNVWLILLICIAICCVFGLINGIVVAYLNVPAFIGTLGMQLAVVEFARNVAGLEDANSSEFVPDGEHSVIDIMEDQKDVTNKGGTMRLGLYPCKLLDGTLVRSIYQEELIYDRHRHRWEFNNAYRKMLTEAGLTIAGLSPDERLVEIVEYHDHPWFIGVQFHPEFKSRPNKPQKLFASFIAAALDKQEQQ